MRESARPLSAGVANRDDRRRGFATSLTGKEGVRSNPGALFVYKQSKQALTLLTGKFGCGEAIATPPFPSFPRRREPILADGTIEARVIEFMDPRLRGDDDGVGDDTKAWPRVPSPSLFPREGGDPVWAPAFAGEQEGVDLG
ncbi:hypothetical protein HMP09_0319 [Sphingomonas sp. HMP9]|nr:hypothetical protein HMP09_0319 [Sphingomonas sp. HMP9]